MTYLEGPKLEDELLRRLNSLGIRSKEELQSMLQTTEEVDNAGKAMVRWDGEASAAGFGHTVADSLADSGRLLRHVGARTFSVVPVCGQNPPPPPPILLSIASFARPFWRLHLPSSDRVKFVCDFKLQLHCD